MVNETNMDVVADSKTKDLLIKLRDMAPDKQYPTLIRWLAGKEERRLALATAVAVQIGEPVASCIVAAALAPRLSDAKRLQLLGIAEKLGLPLSVTQTLNLFTATHLFAPDVGVAMLKALHACKSAKFTNSEARPAGVVAVTAGGELSAAAVTNVRSTIYPATDRQKAEHHGRA